MPQHYENKHHPMGPWGEDKPDYLTFSIFCAVVLVVATAIVTGIGYAAVQLFGNC